MGDEEGASVKGFAVNAVSLSLFKTVKDLCDCMLTLETLMCNEHRREQL